MSAEPGSLCATVPGYCRVRDRTESVSFRTLRIGVYWPARILHKWTTSPKSSPRLCVPTRPVSSDFASIESLHNRQKNFQMGKREWVLWFSAPFWIHKLLCYFSVWAEGCEFRFNYLSFCYFWMWFSLAAGLIANWVPKSSFKTVSAILKTRADGTAQPEPARNRSAANVKREKAGTSAWHSVRPLSPATTKPSRWRRQLQKKEQGTPELGQNLCVQLVVRHHNGFSCASVDTSGSQWTR